MHENFETKEIATGHGLGESIKLQNPFRNCKTFISQFHGGEFVRGNSRTDVYGPDYLLQKDIVFVSFNYRIGIIGFLSLDDESLGVPGNTGLKDQIFALKWIKRNIHNFGGDPENVTIFGE